MNKEMGRFCNFPPKDSLPPKMEMVCFVTNKCNNNCGHCWSKSTYLGRDMPLAWYENFLGGLNYSNISQIKFSGGETLLYPNLKDLMLLVRSNDASIPIGIFTNGSFLFSENGYAKTTEEMISAICELVGDISNVSLQISADEFHIGAFSQKRGVSLKTGQERYALFVLNFIEACDYLEKKLSKFSGKVKLHCDINRASHHRDIIYREINSDLWEKYVILTDGLIRSGNANSILTANYIQESDAWTAFILAGAQFSNHRGSGNSQEYEYNGTTVYLNEADSDSAGAVILGWWNLINKKLIGGCADGFKEYLDG